VKGREGSQGDDEKKTTCKCFIGVLILKDCHFVKVYIPRSKVSIVLRKDKENELVQGRDPN